ncbi:MAG: hypothetical protein H7Y89_15170 [Steroidobacteraceae bacterium]|nr:hypothetical protein [Steroidobacteraceae bacterium]
MKPLDRISLEEQTRLVSRYVAGDLSRSERAEFEAWLVASPELAAEVEMERRMRRGIASAARRGWIKRGANAPAAPDRRWPNRRWQTALAASVLLSLGLGLSLTLPTGTDETPVVAQSRAALKPIAASLTFRLGSLRGAAGSPDISFVKADAPQQLVIEPDVVVLTCEDGTLELECPGGSAPQTPQFPEYEMDLVRRHDASLAWRSARTVPVVGTQLAFTLRDPGRLAAGDYDLLVRGRSPDHDEVVARFLMRIAAQ